MNASEARHQLFVPFICGFRDNILAVRTLEANHMKPRMNSRMNRPSMNSQNKSQVLYTTLTSFAQSKNTPYGHFTLRHIH